ncbi:MAG: 16S rRNA (uracil(1498)-N(3))-methyltransferase [Micromonosporaceae bacterium]
MTAPLFLVDALPDGDRATLAGPEGHHAATVRRMRVGEKLLLSDGRGGTAEATVTGVGRSTLELSITGRHHEPPPPHRFVVVQALAKADRSELAVQAMTEVGVDEVVPWAAARSVVRWQGERGERAWYRWVATAREAAKQSRRSRLPRVAAPASTDDVVARIRDATVALVLDGSAESRLTTVPLPDAGEVLLVVGPEGGLTPAELAAFEGAGAVPVRLGSTVLRTSTAGPAALAVLSARLGRW